MDMRATRERERERKRERFIGSSFSFFKETMEQPCTVSTVSSGFLERVITEEVRFTYQEQSFFCPLKDWQYRLFVRGVLYFYLVVPGYYFRASLAMIGDRTNSLHFFPIFVRVKISRKKQKSKRMTPHTYERTFTHTQTQTHVHTHAHKEVFVTLRKRN